MTRKNARIMPLVLAAALIFTGSGASHASSTRMGTNADNPIVSPLEGRPGTLAYSGINTPDISNADRAVLNDYIKSLPAGVHAASLQNTEFDIGALIPPGTPLVSLPDTILAGLSAPPRGFSYVQSGANVYLISTTERRVIDRVP